MSPPSWVGEPVVGGHGKRAAGQITGPHCTYCFRNGFSIWCVKLISLHISLFYTIIFRDWLPDYTSSSLTVVSGLQLESGFLIYKNQETSFP